MKRRARQFPPLVALLLAACGADAPSLTLMGGSAERLRAWYAIWLQPRPGLPADVALVVTFVDAAFTCAGTPGAVDALSFTFAARAPGATSSVLARSGPRLGGRGDGAVTLDSVDDRFRGTAGDKPLVNPGGHVAGRVLYHTDSGDTLDGAFTAPHCAALDFTAPTT